MWVRCWPGKYLLVSLQGLQYAVTLHSTFDCSYKGVASSCQPGKLESGGVSSGILVWRSVAEKAMATHFSSCLENPMDGGACGLQSMGSRRVRHDWTTSLSLFTFMHWRRKWQHSSVLAWRIPAMAEPGGLPSVGSHRVRHDWSDIAAATAFTERVTII